MSLFSTLEITSAIDLGDNAGFDYFFINASTSFDITLAETTIDGEHFWFHRIDGGSDTVELVPFGTQTINGSTNNFTIPSVSQFLLISKGGGWWTVV